MVFSNTFNNISVILTWESVLLVEETGVPGENHRNAASHWQTLSHTVVYQVHFATSGIVSVAINLYINPTTIQS